MSKSSWQNSPTDFINCLSELHNVSPADYSAVSTARCYAERSIASASRPSVRDVEVSLSQRLEMEFFENIC